MRSLSTAVIIGFLLVGCAGPVVTSKLATQGGLEGVPYCLPRTVLVIDVEVKAETTQISPTATLSVSAQTVADASCSYILQHNKNDSSDDDLKVTIGPNGLLSSLNSESTQQGRAIAEAVTKTAIAVAKLAATEGPFMLFSSQTLPEGLEPVKSRVTAALRRVAGKRTVYVPLPDSLGKAIPDEFPFPEDNTWKLRVSFLPVARPGLGTARPADHMKRECIDPPVGGIVVRGLEPFVAKVELIWNWIVPGTEKWSDESAQAAWLLDQGLKKIGSSWGFQGAFMSTQGLINLPDYSRPAVVQIDRAMFVKTTHSVTLTNGTLANMNINRPSPIAAIATFPAEVAEKLIQLPAELVQLRISNIGAAQKLETTKAQVEKAAQQTRDEEVKSKLTAMNTYSDDLKAALDAMDKWESAIGTNKEQELALAAVKAMNTANASAKIIGMPASFKEEDFPMQYRNLRIQ